MAESNRNELAVESNVLLRRATWCGIVFALAITLTCLNFMPPIAVQYHVRSKVVVSESRLAQLRDLAIADREALQRGVHKRIQLLSVKVLDLADQEQSMGQAATAEQVVLVEVGTLWASRCTSERHFTWLKNISRIDPAKISNSPATVAARFARWELEAARHYQSQFKYQSEKEPIVELETSTQTATNTPRQTFQLAGFSQTTDAVSAQAATGSSVEADFELQLSEQIDVAQEQVKQADFAWQEALEHSSGALQIVSLPIIAPRSTSIPLWMAASILILGLSAGSTAGWLQLRRQSGGACLPMCVAEELQLDSIPLVATLRLPALQGETGAGAASTLQRLPAPLVRVGSRLTRLSEWAVTFWCVLAVTRFFLDSIWRDALIESPLAALGRLMAGMP